ncbi:hypothetical protein [Streptomyces sp. NPDC058280]|uniref:hypothetical protein n=1 Tax=Streptomyces sp. NPDC058280 TaxID=3346419 RepID=UPI0036E5F6C6
MPDTTPAADRVRSAAQRALKALDDLIANTSDPGVEALAARFELATALLNTPAGEPARGELWSLLDWTFWGSGMGDVFREPLADTMLVAISPEQRDQAEQLMEAWHASGRQPLGRRRYEELTAELKAAQAAMAAVLRIVSEVTTEANNIGGVDINDLVIRLGQAGFPLPEDES